MWRDPLLPSQIVRDQGPANRALAPLIAAQSGMILAEDTGLLLVNGQDIPFFAFQYTQLAQEGKWDQAWIVDNLLSGSFSLVVLDEGTREDPDHYQRFTRQMLSALDTAYGLVARVGKYRVYAPQPPAATSNAVFGEQIALRGYRLDAASPPADGDITIPDAAATMPDLNARPPALRVSLLWQAVTPIAQDYKVFVHLTDAGGKMAAQDDSMPFNNLYPTSRWQEGEVVRDVHHLTLPANLPDGRYTLSVGIYDPQTGRRLALPNGDTSLVIATLPVGALQQ